jgi:hypothetical protein
VNARALAPALARPRVEARGSAREQNVEARGSAREQNVEARGSAREQNVEATHRHRRRTPGKITALGADCPSILRKATTGQGEDSDEGRQILLARGSARFDILLARGPARFDILLARGSARFDMCFARHALLDRPAGAGLLASVPR